MASQKSDGLKPWSAGEPLDHRKLNQVVSAVKNIQRGLRGPQQVFPKGGVISSRVEQFKIVSIQGAYITCNPFDGSGVTSKVVLIAKPYLLRSSITSRNGVTYSGYSANGQTRTATQGATVETQNVVPTYLAGDVIYAITGITGGHSVSDVDDWLDINADGRAWGKV